jgi:ERCC4-type nuclease
MEIEIDSREPEVVRKVFKDVATNIDQSIQIKEGMLSIGDYKSGNAVVERKDVSDFLSSLFDGRLFTQLYRMCFYYENRLLLVVGDFRTIQRNLKPIYSSLVSIVVNYKTPLIFCSTEEEGTYIILKYFEKLNEQHPPKIPMKKNEGIDKLKTLKLNLLRCFPNIDLTKATKILEHFNWNLKQIYENRDELPKIVGQVTGEKLKKCLEEVVGDGVGRIDNIW